MLTATAVVGKWTRVLTGDIEDCVHTWIQSSLSMLTLFFPLSKISWQVDSTVLSVHYITGDGTLRTKFPVPVPVQ